MSAEALSKMGHLIGGKFVLPGRSEIYTLHNLRLSPARWCWNGEDILDPGGELLGQFVRIRPNGRPKWITVPMAVAAPVAP